MVRFFARNTEPNAPLLMGLMISKSLMVVGCVLEIGATEGALGEITFDAEPPGLSTMLAAVESRL